MITWPSSRITDENRRGQVNTRNVEIIVVQELAPHPETGFPIFRVCGGRVDADGEIQFRHDSGHFFFEVRQAFRVTSSTFYILLDTDLLLVGENHNLEAVKV